MRTISKNRRWSGLLILAALICGCANSSGGTGGGATGDGSPLDLAERFPTGTNVVEFYSTDCESCKVQEKYTPEFLPDLRRLGVGFYKIRPNTATLRKYRIERYPTFFILHDGREVRRYTGVTYREDLLPTVQRARGVN